MDIPDRIHFFSYATGVSVELPAGFTGSDNEDGATYVAYRDDNSGSDDSGSDESVGAAFVVTVMGGGPDGAGSILVEGMSEAADEVLSRSDEQIDDETVSIAELHYPDGLPAARGMDRTGVGGLLTADIYVCFAAVAFNGKVVTLTGAAPWGEMQAYGPIFVEAMRSCRFIPWEAAS